VLGRFWRWWGRSKAVTWVIVAILLLAVPTVFTVFASESAAWSLTIRSIWGAAWLAIAVLASIRQVFQDRDLGEALNELQAQSANEKAFTGITLLNDFVRPGMMGTPQSFRWTIHLWDESRRRLVPHGYNPQGPDDPRVFAPGVGAVGIAYLDEQVVTLVAPRTFDGSTGLSQSQQAYFQNAQAVAAAPLTSGGVTVGTLSALSESPSDFFEDERGQRRLIQAATMVATILVTLVSAVKDT
jgi:GAF domain-containing protein